MALAFAGPCLAQELSPQRWNHLPIDTNFIAGGYAYTTGDISLDPVLRIEDGELEMHSFTAKYIRTFELLGKSARLDVTQSYQEGRWSGIVNGVSTSVTRDGLSDSVLRLAVNLIGAPPLTGKDYVGYRAKTDNETIVGTALAIHLPTGEYMDDKLINLGANRFVFRPQLGVLHNRGRWSMELTGSAWIYTDNDEFFNGNKLEQDPLYTIQGHLIHTFQPGLWLGASAGYGYGGQSTINGEEKDDRKGVLAWAVSLNYPIKRWLGVKVSYIGSRTQETIGNDTDTISIGLSMFW